MTSTVGADTRADRGPVRWDDDLGVFVVTGFDEASAVLRGPGWSSDPARSPLSPAQMSAAPTGLMLFRDPPDHTRLRRFVAPAFTARAVEALRPRVASIVESCLDGLGEDGDEVDLLADYGYLIPLAVIAELLDVGVEGAEIFLEQTPRLVRMLEIDATPDDLVEATAAAVEVSMFLTPILSRRRGVNRGDDFISALLATDELSLDEVLATCVLLLAAGHETTANIIGTGAMALLQHPDQQPLLFADPARAVEELIRVHGPVRLIGRTAVRPQDLAGVGIGEGQMVLVHVDEANRDERRWSEPMAMDLGRPGPPHLGFGTGIHFCLGAALARLEAAEALVRLFRRYPRIAWLDRDVHWRRSSTFHGLEDLVVRLGQARGSQPIA
jgi:cytochrome P450